MISIFIMYSGDRKPQLETTISFLRRMELYEKCQKTLVVDCKNNVILDDFDIIEVPRINNQFCWADMWQAGVATAKFDKILYLDSDRLLPRSYLSQVNRMLKDNVFLFTSRHFMMIDDIESKELDELVNSPFEKGVFAEERFSRKLKFEPRLKQPFPGPGKNVMSGNTAFTKDTFYNIGGVDRWYCGHGAYADTDFHMNAGKHGCEFLDIPVCEIHCHHEKLQNTSKLSKDELYLLSLDNFIYYIAKWKLPSILAENIAYECKLVKNPTEYVYEKIKKYQNEA